MLFASGCGGSSGSSGSKSSADCGLADAYDQKTGPKLFAWLDQHKWIWMNYDDKAVAEWGRVGTKQRGGVVLACWIVAAANFRPFGANFSTRGAPAVFSAGYTVEPQREVMPIRGNV